MKTVVGARSSRGRRCTSATSPGGNCIVVIGSRQVAGEQTLDVHPNFAGRNLIHKCIDTPPCVWFLNPCQFGQAIAVDGSTYQRSTRRYTYLWKNDDILPSAPSHALAASVVAKSVPLIPPLLFIRIAFLSPHRDRTHLHRGKVVVNASGSRLFSFPVRDRDRHEWGWRILTRAA
jgi:hypothetical protein